MKKTKRTILFLESLENRVVPSNTQALLHSDHLAEAATMTAETAPSQLHEAEASEAAQSAAVADDMSSAASEKAHPVQTESQEHNNSDYANQADKSTQASDEGGSKDPPLTKAATVDSSSVESTETSVADATKADSDKTAHDSESSKAKDSQSDLGNSSRADSAVTSIADPDPVKGSKSDSNNGSAKNDNGSKNTASSAASQGADQTVSSSTTDTGNVTDSGSAKSVGDTGKNAVTDKTNHGKSNSDHKDTQATDTSTDVVSTNGIPAVGAPQQLVEQAKLDARLANAEANATSGKTASVATIGFALDTQGSAAAFSSVAAVITAKDAGANLPLLADAAIPVALPILETLLPTGLGELGLTDSLSPVAGDLIVGFLPVEQIALTPAMQGVLNQLDELGEQLVGASAAKWLYPIILTALAATTVYQLASRRRRQFRGQSIWAKDGGTWSSTWFPFLSSSIQK
jgi:hypothetical protein